MEEMMKQMIAVVCFMFATAPLAFAQDKTKEADRKAPVTKSDKPAAQQDKMKSCNKEAAEKKMKGDERKSFMKDCLAK
jgi:hypothetical protein